MKKCISCKEEVPDNALLCKNCLTKKDKKRSFSGFVKTPHNFGPFGQPKPKNI